MCESSVIFTLSVKLKEMLTMRTIIRQRVFLFSARLIRLTAVKVYRVRILDKDNSICFLRY